MQVKIINCYETSLGTIVIFGTPINFIPFTGMKLIGKQDEILEIVSISFKTIDSTGIQKGEYKNELIYRGYQVKTITLSKQKEDKPDCKYLINNQWSLLTN